MTGIKVTDTLSVSPQIDVNALENLKAEGFTQIICNRPDGEDAAQIPFAIIAKKAESLGLKAVHIPVTPPTMNLENALAFAEAAVGSEKTFAYCRTGTRSISLWAIAQLKAGANAAEIISVGQACGYDLTTLVSRFG